MEKYLLMTEPTTAMKKETVQHTGYLGWEEKEA